MSESSRVELYFGTYGSFGQFGKALAILKNGRMLDPERIKTSRGDRFKARYGDIEVEVVDRSSRKNRHVCVYVPSDAVLAVIKEHASSSGWKGYQLEGEGKIVGEVEEKTFINGNKEVIVREKVYKYVNGDLVVELKRSRMGLETRLLSKPRLIVTKSNGYLMVAGDTYHVKDQLKSLGFRWDSLKKQWAKIFDEETMGRLRELGEVVEREV